LSRIAAPVVVAVGFTGGRLDHQLAVLHGLLRYPDRPCVLLGGSECTFLLPRALTLDLAQGDVVSLFPLAPVSCRSTGLRWEIDGLDFAPGRVIGTSNEAMGQVCLEACAPAMIATVPRAAFVQVVEGLAEFEADARWPAHAG
jgi:thiamine pyrophosphokinase